MLMIFCQKANGQFSFNHDSLRLKNKPKYAYRVIQYSESKVARIEEVDLKGRIIFKYEESNDVRFYKNKNPHVIIRAFEYDEKGKVTKEYSFNSNSGHNIYTYEYDNSQTTKISYSQSFTDSTEVEVNTNKYYNISRIDNFKKLIESFEVNNILKSPKVISEIEFFNSNGNLIKTKYYDKLDEDTIVTFIDYNSNDKVLFKKSYTSSNMELIKEILDEYPNEYSTITRIISYNKWGQNYVHNFAVIRNHSDKAVTHYSISDKELNIRRSIFDNKGYLKKIVVYKTDYHDSLIVSIDDNLSKTSEMQYSYYKNGLLLSEHMIDYLSGNQETRRYKYRLNLIK